jgi:hypothetical protein
MKGGMAVPPFLLVCPVRYISHQCFRLPQRGLLRHLLVSSLDTAVVRTRRDRGWLAIYVVGISRRPCRSRAAPSIGHSTTTAGRPVRAGAGLPADQP